MPFTPFHFGPAACVALPLHRKVDVPAFILVNIAVDMEPLLVLLFDLDYPLHGYAHTLPGAAIVGLVSGWVCYRLRAQFERGMSYIRLNYRAELPIALFSGVAGAWMHVILDAFLYDDIRLFYPLAGNPLLGLISISKMYLLCGLALLPAAVLYFVFRKPHDGHHIS